MAITIVQQPQTLNMKRSNATFVCSSTNVANTGFKFIVVVKDGAGTQIGKYYIPANPSNRLIFDLAPVIDQEVKIDVDDANNDAIIFNLPNSSNDIMSGCSTGFLKFEVEFGELYEVGGVLTEDLNLASADKYFLDGATQYNKGLNYEYIELEANHFKRKTWLTDRELSSSKVDDAYHIKAGNNDRGVVCFLNDSTGIINSDATKIQYKIYNASGLQATENLSITSAIGIGSPASANVTEKLAYFGCLPSNIGNNSSPFTADYLNVTDWTYYTFQLTDNSGTAKSRHLVIERSDAPCKNEYAVLTWQNQVGGWDWFRFDGKSDINIEKKGKDYTKPIGAYGNATFSYDTYSRQKTSFTINNKKRFVLRTGVIDATEQELLSNLLKSQNVMMEYEFEWLPVTVDVNSFTVQQQTAQVKFASITVEIAQDQL